ncbi:hypothetical protein DMA39_09320 [Salmonella enterica subsp. enterica serovar Muenchen]|nr:hypothetical protein [Salmonella enterica subsp. enterica serovar Muenchen]EBW2621980.1 hypothetical protein [Salmonella enterica subsp. enterica serovar Muenchen]EBY7017136.1 hypothetical protein [Salmonella enterica subsp. enterica serovar Muenchen]ECA1151114.1 hypothetical protein [Salmonella enterica subsp. enterica serovar Muenchen]ECA1886058.1 hypothetical protein [Salmonella enterica subsp. enterica serovar Muenchen]
MLKKTGFKTGFSAKFKQHLLMAEKVKTDSKHPKTDSKKDKPDSKHPKTDSDRIQFFNINYM